MTTRTQQPSAASVVPVSVLDSRSHRILIGILLAASLVPVWSVTYFPSQNGPWHLLVSKMLHDYVAGTSFNYFDYYQLVPHVIPHLLHTLLVTLLQFFFPILIAQKIAVSLYVVLLPLSVFAFLYAVDPRKTIFGYAGFLFVYNLPLMRGYHDYSIGIPVVLFTLAYWLRTWERQTGLRTAILAALILLAYLSHIFNFLILGLVILLFSYYRTRNVRRTIVALLPFLPTSVLVVDFTVLMLSRSAWMSGYDLEFLPPHRAIAHFVQFAYTVSQSAGVILVVPFLFVIYAVGRTLRETVATYRRTGQLEGGIYLLLMGVLFAAYLVMPYKFFGWHFANTRFIPFVLVSILAYASPYPGVTIRRMFLTTTALSAFAAYALLTVQFVRADGQLKEYVSGVEHFQSNGLLYPIHFRQDPVGQILPLTRAHEYYHIFRGGANGRGLAMYNTLTPMPYRVYPVAQQFPVWRPWDSDTRTARVADRYDYVLSWGSTPAFAASVLAAHFKLIHRQGELHLYENARARDVRLATQSGARQ